VVGRGGDLFLVGEAPERLNDFDEAADLPNPAFWLHSMLAEPRDNVWHAEGRYASNPSNHFSRNLDANDAADPWLGTRVGLAESRDPCRAIASLKFSGRAGASPHQRCGSFF
jgi:hypothetical protein